MRTNLDICDVKNSKKQDDHGENCEKYHFQLDFLLFLQNPRN